MNQNGIMPKMNAGQTAWVPQTWEQSVPGTGVSTQNAVSVANGIASTTVPAPAAGSGQYARLTSIMVSGLGATLAGVVGMTVTGVLGGTITIPVSVVAGILIANSPLSLTFNPPLIAAAPETAITVSVPALGAGNTQSNLLVTGLQA